MSENQQPIAWRVWYQEWPVWVEPTQPVRRLGEFSHKWAAQAFKCALKACDTNVVACAVPVFWDCDYEVFDDDVIVDDEDEPLTVEKYREVITFPGPKGGGAR